MFDNIEQKDFSFFLINQVLDFSNVSKSNNNTYSLISPLINSYVIYSLFNLTKRLLINSLI
jgi:hypothetical protein